MTPALDDHKAQARAYHGMNPPRFQEARPHWQAILKEQPLDGDANLGLGVILMIVDQRPDLALPCLVRAAEAKPDDINCVSNVGTAYAMLSRYDEAFQWFSKVEALKADDPNNWFNKGVVLAALGRAPEARDAYDRACALDPRHAIAHSNAIYIRDIIADDEDAARLRKLWNERHAVPLKKLWAPHENGKDPGRRLRIGYCSGDFGFHSAMFILKPILEHHDRDQFEVFAYSSTLKHDSYTDLFRDETRWRNVAQATPEQMAQRVRRDGIDILVDLSGHSRENCMLVFAMKPAPVQVTAWGHAIGTGLEAIDYFFADRVCVPTAHEDRFVEQVIHLPSIVCWQAQQPTPPIQPPPCVANGFITFGAYNRLEKVSDAAFDLWAEVLRAIPTARMVVKCGDMEHPLHRDRVLTAFKDRGVETSRVYIRGRTVHYEHMNQISAVDIMLDPFPHGGGILGLETFWMGVPTVTLCGRTIPGRLMTSFATTLGLPEWVAQTPAEYTKIACDWAGKTAELVTLRTTLRGRMERSIIMQHGAYTKAVEDQYHWMWKRYCERTP